MADAPPPPLLTWTTHPLTERPAAAVAALIAVAALATASGMFGGDWLWGLSALLILGVSLNRFWTTSQLSDSQGGVVNSRNVASVVNANLVPSPSIELRLYL